MPSTEDLRRHVRTLLPDDPLAEFAASQPEGLESIGQPMDATIRGLRKTAEDVPLEPDEAYAIEAIVLPRLRPVIDVVDGDYTAPADAPPELDGIGTDEVRARLRAAIPSIGRIAVPTLPLVPFAGTGFVVGPNLLMTNRHVAELFTVGLGREGVAFKTGHEAEVDFLVEQGRPATDLLRLVRILAIHPHWDTALLEVDGLDPATHPALTLSTTPAEDLVDSQVAVVGYPALDPRNDIPLQQEIFRKTFNVKRLQPGLLRTTRSTRSFGHDVDAVTHDASTLGGNSGSAVIDTRTGAVVALHFGGRYLDANFGVPMHQLALDSALADLGLAFDRDIAVDPSPWAALWKAAGTERTATPPATAPPTTTTTATTVAAVGDGLTATVLVPLEVTVRVGTPQGSPAPAPTAPVADAPAPTDPGPGTEAMVEPFHEGELEARPGYDPDFLGTTVPLPHVTAEDQVSWPERDDPVLRYEHFSIVMNRQRRLAFFTASNVTAAPALRKPEPGFPYGRKDLGGLGANDTERWFPDPRIPADHQLPDRFFTKDRKSFDKGHLVRRDDVAWGSTYRQLRRANGDTYHVTNCSPQTSAFNQSRLGGLWGRLENVVLGQAGTERLTVLAGPVFADDDRRFAGVDDQSPIVVRIPQRYWKVVVAATDGGLASYGFVLTQPVDAVDWGEPDEIELVLPDEWRTLMCPLAELAELIDPVVLPPEVLDADQHGRI